MSQPPLNPPNQRQEAGAAPQGYAEALAELETILAELERTDVDVDVLAAQVKRASELIGFCRDRIGNARLQIEQVVAELATGES